jgi:hypothetical protein
VLRQDADANVYRQCLVGQGENVSRLNPVGGSLSVR